MVSGVRRPMMIIAAVDVTCTLGGWWAVVGGGRRGCLGGGGLQITV